MDDADARDGEDRAPRRSACLTEMATPALVAGAAALSALLWLLIRAVI